MDYSYDAILQAVSGTATASLGSYNNAVAAPDVQDAVTQMKKALRWTALASVSKTDATFGNALSLDAAAPSASASSSVAEWASEVVERDAFAAPATSDTSAHILPTVLQCVMLLCKRAAVSHLACRLGDVPAQAGGSPCKTFSAGLAAACNAHVTAICQLLASRIPFDNDTNAASGLPDENTHLSLCQGEITRYVRAAAAAAASTGSGSTQLSGAALVTSASQTNALFNLPSAPQAETVIYHCLQPWLRLMFIMTFVSARNAPFIDMWSAQLMVLLGGYGIMQECQDALAATADPAATVFEATAAAIAAHFSTLATAQERLRLLYDKVMWAIRANMTESKALTQRGSELALRRNNMEMLGSQYASNKKDAQRARAQFYAVVAVYAVATAAVGALAVYQPYAHISILLSGLLMVAVIVYALAMTIRGARKA